MILRPPRSTLFPLHDALPISLIERHLADVGLDLGEVRVGGGREAEVLGDAPAQIARDFGRAAIVVARCGGGAVQDRKSTRLNSSHSSISYAVFCLKKKIE